MREKRKKSICRIHVMLALLAVLLGYIGSRLSAQQMGNTILTRYYVDMQMPENTVSILDQVTMTVKNSHLDGMKVFKDRADANLFLTFTNNALHRVRTVELVLEEPFQKAVTCVFFYKKPEEKYIEKNKAEFVLPKGETHVYFEIGEELPYLLSEIRIDIDEDYIIKDVRMSDQPFHVEYTCKTPVWPAFLYMIVTMLLLELLWHFRKTVKDLLRKIGKKINEQRRLLLTWSGGLVVGYLFCSVLFACLGKEFSTFWKAVSCLFLFLAGFQVCLLIRRESSPLEVVRERRLSTAQAFLWTMVFILCGFIGFAWLDGIEKTKELAGNMKFFFPFVFAAAEVVLLTLLARKYLCGREESQIPYQSIYMFLFLLLGLGYLLLFLPFVSPDEPSHYASAYRVSNYLLCRIPQWGEERLLMRTEDFLFMPQGSQSLGSEKYLELVKSFSVFTHDRSYTAVSAPMETNAIFSYLVPGLGIAVARALSLSAPLTFYMGRIFNLLFFAMILWYLWKTIPFGQTALFTVAVMPMMLHTAASFSYDVSTIGFVWLFVVQVLKMRYGSSQIGRKEYGLCFLYGVLMIPSKLVYTPLVFLLLTVPYERFAKEKKEGRRKRMVLLARILLAAMVILLFVSIFNKDSTIRQVLQEETSVDYLSWTDKPGFSISYILTHPWTYLLMNMRTIVKLTEYYFYTLLGSKLGWLNVNLPSVYMTVSFLLFFLSVYIQDEKAERKGREISVKVGILLLGTAVFGAVLLIMAISWTPASENYIQGVQGRYFIPLLIPVIWLLQSSYISVKGAFRKVILYLEAMLNLWILVYIFSQYMM